MSRFTLIGAGGAALVLLVWTCFGPAIEGRQFAYRDAAHFYYPLYERVEKEWNEGRWPLWEPEENAGMPLLGNPTAAVLYPGKLIYRALPYPLAARVYVIAHTLLAFAGAIALSRTLGIGIAGSLIAGIAYAFGAPILFQYCNIIYLVGAAWVPWGIREIDRWLRLGRRSAIVGLAVVLAMQVLGGDPQAAYLEGLCAGVYAILLSRDERARPPMRGWKKLAWVVGLVVVLAIWVGLTLALAAYLPTIRPKVPPPPPTRSFPWNSYVPLAVAACWAVAGLVFALRWFKGGVGLASLGRRFVGLGAAAVLAASVSAAQLLPVMEFTNLTGRNADEGSHDIYPFSLEPYRAAELAWPNLFGSHDRGNRSWLTMLPPLASHKLWVPSLYIGGATVALALTVLGFRKKPIWGRWMAGIAVVTLVASMGEFAGPLWVARYFQPIVGSLGPHDPNPTNAIRQDGFLRDGDGSFYWLISTAIPGFQQFRYPSKLLTFTVLALAVLAGHGWDRIEAGDRRRAFVLGGGLFLLTGVAALGVQIGHERIVRTFAAHGQASSFGPIEPEATFAEMRTGLFHAAASFGALLVATGLARRWPQAAGALLVIAIAADIGRANGRLIATADQSEFESVPKAIEIIREAERANPSPGPYRVHRAPIWSPTIWSTAGSSDRHNEFLRWERDSIQPKYGLPFGIQYTYTLGVAELYDYEWFFGPFEPKANRNVRAMLHLPENVEQFVYYPRRGFDLWNTRYFILPGYTVWTHPERGVASLVQDTQRIYPAPDAFIGADSAKLQESWLLHEDMQILRNLRALPRAWVVHDARFLTPLEGLSREQRKDPMEEMLYNDDGLWSSHDRRAYDPRSMAWIEVADRNSLSPYVTRGLSGVNEAVTVIERDPQRVELEVTMERPGFVVLADAYYPGWTLTIDDKAAPILRVNRMMRGAAVESGKHRLVYEYHPRSFAIGKGVSLAGLLALLLTAGWAAWGQSSPRRTDVA
jgi:hypothetical protein